MSWLKKVVDIYERKVIVDMLNNNHWHQGNTAAQLGITSVTLHLKMRKYGLLRKQMGTKGAQHGNSIEISR